MGGDSRRPRPITEVNAFGKAGAARRNPNPEFPACGGLDSVPTRAHYPFAACGAPGGCAPMPIKKWSRRRSTLRRRMLGMAMTMIHDARSASADARTPRGVTRTRAPEAGPGSAGVTGRGGGRLERRRVP